MLCLLLFVVLAVRADFVFDENVHFIFNTTYNFNGDFAYFDIIYGYVGITSLSATSLAVNPVTSGYSSNLTAEFLQLDPANYADLVAGNLIYANDIYQGNACMIKYDVQLIFPSIGSHNVTLHIDSNSYIGGANTHTQESYSYLIPSDEMHFLNVTIDSTTYNIQFGYTPAAVVQTYPSSIYSYIAKYSVFIVGTEIFFPTTNPGEETIVSFMFDGMYLNIRETFQYYTACIVSAISDRK